MGKAWRVEYGSLRLPKSYCEMQPVYKRLGAFVNRSWVYKGLSLQISLSP